MTLGVLTPTRNFEGAGEVEVREDEVVRLY